MEKETEGQKELRSMQQKNGTISSQIDLAAMKNQLDNITLDDIKGGLKRDVYSAYSLFAEILSNPDCLEALAKVFYARVEKHRENLKAQPEIKFKD